MRRPIVVGNWKMNTNLECGFSLTREIIENTRAITDVDIIIAPPFLNIPSLHNILNKSEIRLCAQNCSNEKKGAHTGEISASMLRDSGVSHVIIGHSERRENFAESNEIIARKLFASIEENLIPILCFGEPLSARESGSALTYVETQLNLSLLQVFKDPPKYLILAYEPIWAIGSGQTATPEQAQEIHSFTRESVSNKYGSDYAKKIRILYGGSVKPENALELFEQPDIDGGLIGGASLIAGDFTEIIKSASRI